MNGKINTSNKNSKNFGIPEDIITACRKISDKAFEVADPTQYFPVNLDTKYLIYKQEDGSDLYNYEQEDILKDIEGIKYNALISLMCSGILNVSPIIKGQNYYYSIPLNSKEIKQQLEFKEIIADIALFGLLFEWKGQPSDRSLLLQKNYRTKTGEHISCHNASIFSQGSYSIWDIVGDIGTSIKKSKVIKNFLDHIIELLHHDNNSFAIKNLIDHDILDETFGERVLNRINIFLNSYSGDQGEKFFFEQVTYIFGNNEKKNEWIKEYNVFITNLANIKDIFEKDNDALYNYMAYNLDLEQKQVERELEEAKKSYDKYLKRREDEIKGEKVKPRYI